MDENKEATNRKDPSEEEQQDASENTDIKDDSKSETTTDGEKEATTEDSLNEEKNRYLRLFAEFENYKKRTTKEKFESLKYANQDVLVSLLPVTDDFERAIKEMNKRGNEDDLKGVELIFQKFKNILKEKGLTPINVEIGDAFDVDQHEAVTQIPAPSEDLKGKILDIIQSGYVLHDKVVRFAKVVVGA